MTTIAWDGKILAADTESTLYRSKRNKIHRISRTKIFGSCGLVSENEAVRRWLTLNDEKPKVTENFHGIIIDNGKLFILEEGLIPVPYSNRFFAVGSGRDFAMTAMYLGQSAIEAVKIAHRFDQQTGPKVSFLKP